MLSILLSTTIIVLSICFCFSRPIHASSPHTITNFLKAALLEKGKSVTGDTIFEFFNWMYDLYEESNQEICDFMSKDNLNQFLSLLPDMLGLEGEVITQNDNDTYTVTKAFLDEIDSLFEQYLQETPETIDVVWMPVISSDKVLATYFSTLQGYYQFRSWTDNEPLTLMLADAYNTSTGAIRYLCFFPLTDTVVLHGTGGCSGALNWESFIPANAYWTATWGNAHTTSDMLGGFSLCRSDGIDINYIDSNFPPSHIMRNYASENNDIIQFEDICPSDSRLYMYRFLYQYPFNEVLYSFHLDKLYNPSPALFVRGCNTDAPAFIPVFKSVNAYKTWITGQADYYRFASDYSGGDITINPNVDYDQITTAIQNAMRQSTENGDSFESMLSQMQAAFSKTLAELSGTLDEIGDNTAESNSWLEKIYEKLSDLYDQIVPSEPEETKKGVNQS